MDQQWSIFNKKITVKIDCIVHSNPSTQVCDFIFISVCFSIDGLNHLLKIGHNVAISDPISYFNLGRSVDFVSTV